MLRLKEGGPIYSIEVGHFTSIEITFALERRAGFSGQLDVLVNDALDRIAAKPITPIAHEQRLVVGAAALTKPHAERLSAVFP